MTSKSAGTGPSSYEKRIYRAAVSQRLRTTAIENQVQSLISPSGMFAVQSDNGTGPFPKTPNPPLLPEQHNSASASYHPSVTRRCTLNLSGAAVVL